jgi:salicylate hydroxylase
MCVPSRYIRKHARPALREFETALKVLIAGGGIGGLCAALALLKAGIDCEVFEQAPELKEIGAGLQLSPNGNRVLFALGLEADVRHWGVQTRDKEIRLWNTGQTWSQFDPRAGTSEERYGFPMYLMHRGDLHALLVAAVRREKADAIRVAARCIDFRQDDAGIELLLEHGQSARGEVLVAADGLHSRVRQALFGPAEPKFTGVVAWRGMVPIERLPPHLRRPLSSQWIGPKGHATCYPVRRGELLNFVGEVERDDWRVESWIERGTHAECLGDYPGWHADLLSIIQGTQVLYKWAIFLRAPLPKWSVGRVSLLGDACHPTVPFLGQGANMAIEDAYVLAACLAQGARDPAAALARYEEARRERTTTIVRRSAELQHTLHNPALSQPETAPAFVAAHFGPEAVRERYDWIYRYDATAVLT